MDNILIKLPESIKKLIKNKKFIQDNIGMSQAKILLFDDMVLKIDKYNNKNQDTVEMMKWLSDKVLVPKVICCETDGEFQYLLMSRTKGKMACDDYYLEHPSELLKILAKGLKMLWEVDITNCPRNRNIEAELLDAKYQIDNNLVDMDNIEPTTFGPNGFDNPRMLLKWLEENKPDYEPVLSHGDFCLPNIFIEDGDISGYIDLGNAGVGDKWRDIALCYRSLKNNFNGTYGNKVYPDFNPDELFDYLNIKPNYKKIKYYLLLDELF